MSAEPAYDIVLKGGKVIDPSANVEGVLDVGIRNGRIAAVAPELNGARSVIDVSGKMVCPGLIDLHGHWYEGSSFGVDPNVCLNHGVTTVVDAGTTGFVNFPYFLRHTIDPARIRVLAFLHIGCIGLPTTIVGELEDLRYARPVETAQLIDENRDILLGVKLRAGTMTGGHAVEAFELALDACRSSSTPMMLHVSKESPTRELLKRMRPGDILTHCFEGRGDGLFDADSGPLPEAVEARERGVIFDVGHGAGSFSWEVARRAFETSFQPDTISTDLHRFCIERWAMDLPTTMSKFLHLGMPLRDAIFKTTWAPAQVIGREDLGNLKPGSIADVLVFTVDEGEFDLEDTHLRVEKSLRRITPRLVLRNGEVFEPGSRPVKLRPLLPCDLEVLEFVARTK